ncbi:rhomboid-related protein 4-like [Thrips palmi]|uniref:Rhomboid-related protein 4-like n=1 Tax=Thrips palmi TaxID=161013 RepID=A0A6P8ZL84_THRPL|nr:rhomboid-related protein 4-like [Thrips palmi]
MRNNRRGRGLGLGVIMLLSEIMSTGYTVIPPVTLGTIIGQSLLYMGIIDVPWDQWGACLSAHNIWKGREWHRLFLSAVEHADDRHLFYNMVSFLAKAKTLEPWYGSANFALLLVFLTAFTNVCYVITAMVVAELFSNNAHLHTCVIGFSGVLFALKVIATMETNPNAQTKIAGIPMPSKYAPWAELILIHVMVPNTSFMGHLAGIIAGLAYTSTPVGVVVDSIIKSITGCAMWHRWNLRYYR